MSIVALQQDLSEPARAVDPISEAVVLYTGFGRSSFPRARAGDLVTRFGAEAAADLRQRIVALLEELQQPLAAPEKRTKKSVTERAIERLRSQHPELHAEALKALAWTYAFGLR